MNRLILIVSILIAACSSDSGNKNNGDVGADVGTDMVQTQTDVGVTEPDMESELPPPFMRSPIFDVGEYNIGYRSFDHTYDAVGEAGRTIRIAVWYPTRDEDGIQARYASLINRPTIWADASLAPDGPYPLLVFSHGNGGLAEQSYYMTEFFTSHGFIVASADHTGNTFREIQETGITLDSALYRPQDVSAMIDAIQSFPADDILADQTTSQIAMSGHSFGGLTTFANLGAAFNVDGLLSLCAGGTVDPELCATFTGEQQDAFRAGFHDPRILIGLPQTPAGAIVFAQGLGDVTVPVQLWTAGRDQTLPNALQGTPIWNQLRGDHYRIDISNAGHFTFSNMCALFGFIEAVQNDGCGPSFLPYADAFPIINAYSLAFVRKHFGSTDEYDGLLDGTARPYEAELAISVKNQ